MDHQINLLRCGSGTCELCDWLSACYITAASVHLLLQYTVQCVGLRVMFPRSETSVDNLIFSWWTERPLAKKKII